MGADARVKLRAINLLRRRVRPGERPHQLPSRPAFILRRIRIRSNAQCGDISIKIAPQRKQESRQPVPSPSGRHQTAPVLAQVDIAAAHRAGQQRTVSAPSARGAKVCPRIAAGEPGMLERSTLTGRSTPSAPSKLVTNWRIVTCGCSSMAGARRAPRRPARPAVKERGPVLGGLRHERSFPVRLEREPITLASSRSAKRGSRLSAGRSSTRSAQFSNWALLVGGDVEQPVGGRERAGRVAGHVLVAHRLPARRRSSQFTAQPIAATVDSSIDTSMHRLRGCARAEQRRDDQQFAAVMLLVVSATDSRRATARSSLGGRRSRSSRRRGPG